jgi:glycosyltransferase involved in cell wall biosynthesis
MKHDSTRHHHHANQRWPNCISGAIDLKACKGIVMVGTSPEARGGIASVVQGYAASGLLAKWRVRYLTTHVQKSGLVKLWVALLAFFQLLWLLLTRRVALLHVHMSTGASTWRKAIFLVAGMTFGVPCLIHMHGGNYVDFFELECGPLRQRFIRWLFTHAAKVIVLSPSWRTDVLAIAPASKTVVLYNSIALPDLDRVPFESSTDDVSSILFLGRLSEPKGAFDLIRAAALVRGSFKITLCGPGELDRAKALVTELGLDSKVEFVEWVAGKAKEQLLSNAQIFVLPSHYEGVPMAILEAMAWALPVVATTVGGIPEVVSHGVDGLLVEPSAIEDLAQAINALLSTKSQCEEMGLAGRMKIEQRYCQAVLLPQLEQLWVDTGALRT